MPLLIRILFLLVTVFATIGITHAAEDAHGLYTRILQDHVDENGLVDYKSLSVDKRLGEYLKQLEQTDPSALGENDRLAFWINVYNAFTLQLILDNYPLESIHDLHDLFSWKLSVVTSKSIWDKDIIEIKGKPMSLFDVEKKEVWERFKEPRIHFALVCASISCPKLRREAYEGHKLEQQLESQTGYFLKNVSKNKYDLKRRKAWVSEIFDWYKKDFGKNKQERLRFIARYAPDEVAASIRENPEQWKIGYIDYDWGLNEQ